MSGPEETSRERLAVVVAGHVDHGKSTLVGRLLADTGSLPQGKLEAVRSFCARNSKPFEYAFLLDALKDEQGQGITIAAARVFFRTPRRDYLLIDAPGHVEFLKDLVTGAAHAQAALLVVDAREGVRENTRRHGYLLSLMGVSRIAVVVNKMDSVGFGEEAFQGVCADCRSFLAKLRAEASCFVPAAAARGDNVAARGDAMPWYSGPTVLEALDAFAAEPSRRERPLRLPVQEVYRFASRGDERRIVAGTVEAGVLRAGDQVVFYPSGKTSAVRSLEGFPEAPAGPVEAGEAAGFTLAEPIYVRRGEVAARAGEPAPRSAKRLRASLFWLGREPLRPGQDYVLKLGTARVRARLEAVSFTLDADTLEVREGPDRVERHEAAECVLALDAAVACDRAQDDPALGRFVLVDECVISGGGLVLEALPDRSAWAREKVIRRNLKWRHGLVDLARREAWLGQKAALVVVTGSDGPARRAAAKALEERLFAAGRFVYFLGIGSVRYGVDADIRDGGGGHDEEIRRLAEVAHLILDAGLILVLTAAALTPEDSDLILTGVDPARVVFVWVGPAPEAGAPCGLRLGAVPAAESAQRIEALLRDKGLLPP